MSQTTPKAARKAEPPRELAEVADLPGTRNAIIAATIEIMREDGYASVSSRRIAERAGLKSKLVHYYFSKMDDLFLAVYRQLEDNYLDALRKVMVSDRPLRDLWAMNSDSTNTKLTAELVALAHHRKSLREEIARSSERSRKLKSAIVERALREKGIDTDVYDPLFMAVAVMALSRLLAMDDVLGVSTGHEETARFIENFLRRFEDGRAPLPPLAQRGETIDTDVSRN